MEIHHIKNVKSFQAGEMIFRSSFNPDHPNRKILIEESSKFCDEKSRSRISRTKCPNGKWACDEPTTTIRFFAETSNKFWTVGLLNLSDKITLPQVQ
jgi:hypothetical protein